MIINWATYAGVDVAQLLRTHLLTNSFNDVSVPNTDVFSDPLPGVVKILTVNYTDSNDVVHTSHIYDSCGFTLGQPFLTSNTSLLQQYYTLHRIVPSDIYQHLPTLYRYASECEHITEMGVRFIVSTYALLMGMPKKMISYDINNCAWQPVQAMVKDDTDFTFIQADTRACTIEETDLLFIDTLHNYSQLQIELLLHAGVVRKYIIFHDTTTYEWVGETEAVGLWPAIEEFLVNTPEWALHERFTNNNGLTILKRK